MKDWVKDKLDRIDELFPPERLSKSRERWTALWEGRRPADRFPFLTGYPAYRPYDDNHPPEERLRASLDGCILLGWGLDDFIPSIFPGCNQATIPSMFGAEPVRVGQETSCKRLIYAPEDIDRLPEPAILPGTPAYDWLVMQQYLLEETEGRIPIHVCDMQGPADVCGQLWGYDGLFVCAYEQPEQYEKLMARATDAFLLLWKEQSKLLGPAFVGTHLFAWDWVPPGLGASLSADSMVMVSPTFFREFYAPYLERISAELGGLAVHSCGNFAPVIGELCRVPGLRAVNASQLGIGQILDAGLLPGKVVIAMAGKDSATDIFMLAKERGFFPDISFMDVWPMQGDAAKPLEAWTAGERLAFDRAQAMLLQAAEL